MPLAEAAGLVTAGCPKTTREMMLESTILHPDDLALVSMYQTVARHLRNSISETGKCLTWTYRQLNDKAEKLASSLFARGIRPGMGLAVFLPSGAEWTLLFWASAKLGTTFIPLDERSVSRKNEVHHFFNVTKPASLFVSTAANAQMLLDNCAEVLGAVAVRVITEPTKSPLDGWDDLESYLTEETRSIGLEAANQSRVYTCPTTYHASGDHPNINGYDTQSISRGGRLSSQPGSDLDQVVYILFTSGTSGLPKACSITHRIIWASVNAAKGLYYLDQKSRIVANLPPFHGWGLFGMLYAWLSGSTVITPSHTFDAGMAIEAISELRCTHISGIPTMLLALMKHPSFHPEKTRSLKCVLLGGTVVSPAIAQSATDTQSLGASAAVPSFGMSEGAPVCGSPPGKDLRVKHGAVSMGQALPGVKIRVCAAQSRHILGRGEVGELHYGGDIVISGYLYGDNKSFYDDESGHWIATGDEAMMDADGNIFIFGRYKDIIIRGGENLSPGLIENCLGQAGVQGQIVGVPDEIAGEVPLAVIQTSNPEHIPRKKIHDLLMESLGPTCLPTAYITLTELGIPSFPLTTSGKVLKSALRERVLEYLSDQAVKEQATAVTAPSISLSRDVKLFVSSTVASLTGLSEDSMPQDQPLTTLLDSINILRLQSRIQQVTSINIPINKLLGSTSINTLANEFYVIPGTQSPRVAHVPPRPGPPAATDMVHTQDDTGCALRTRAQAEALLAKYSMSWEDVEDVFPIPDLYSRGFDATRPLASTVRLKFVINSISISRLRTALETTLKNWPMLRSFAMRFDNIPLFVILRANMVALQASIQELAEVESLDQVERVRFPKAEHNNVHLASGGPLARFGIARVKDTDCSIIMMLVHHSTFDAISLGAFNRDLEANVQDEATIESYTNYKLFADLFYQHRNSNVAQKAIAFHIDRLRGIGLLRESIWPPQRCIGSFIGDDTGYHIPPTLRNPLLLQERSQIDADNGHGGLIGIKAIAHLDDLDLLRSEHGISAPVLFKAACAILTSQLAGTSEVCFAQSQAGRHWPFLDDSIAAYLPNPITIAGNTLALVMNRIRIDPTATVGSLLLHLEEEQRLLTRYAHAPGSSIVAQLSPADAETFNAARRQLLNWNPVMGDVAAREGGAKWELRSIEGFTEVMLEWHCGVVGSKAMLTAQWDGAQFGAATVRTWTTAFMVALDWVARAAHWDCRLGELDLKLSVGGA